MWRPDALLMAAEPLRRSVAVARAAWTMEKARPRLGSRTRDELAFLPSVIELAETPASPLGRATALTIMALIAASAVWATVGEVDIHATAQGKIITAGKTKPVAPLESAMVAAIHVRDGDRVRAGDVLVELDRTDPVADAARYAREWLEQVVTAARLRALLDDRDELQITSPLAGEVGRERGRVRGETSDRSEGSSTGAIPPGLLSVHQATLRQKLADHRATIGSLRQELAEKEAKVSSSRADLERLVRTVPVIEERARAKEEAAAGGYGSRDEALATRQEAIDRRQQMEAARHELRGAEAAVGTARQHLEQAEAQFRAEALSQLAEAEQKAASLHEEKTKAEQRSQRFALTAPADGIVQQLTVHAPGAVATQGQPVLMVVPDGEGIAVEAMLPNRDVGFVRPGQEAEIKIESFPFTRYGTIPGTVIIVSGDAVESDDATAAGRRAAAGGSSSAVPDKSSGESGPLYAVRIALGSDHIRTDGRDVALTPGMAVTVEIKTGRRRVISYVLDPVIRARDESFGER
jgi:hemolysin D